MLGFPLAHVVGHLQTELPPADDDRPVAGRDFAGEHVDGRAHDLVLDSGDVGDERRCPGGHHHGVGLEGVDRLGRDLLVHLDRDACLLSLGDEVLDPHADVLLQRGHRGDPPLPTELVALLHQGHAMTPLCGHPGGLEPTRAPADDQNVLGLLRRRDDHLLFLGRGRIERAGHADAAHEVHAAAQAAAEAGADLVQISSRRLVGKVGIGNQRSSHGDEIDLVFPEDLLGQQWILDAADGYHRHAADLLQRCRPVVVRAEWIHR